MAGFYSLVVVSVRKPVWERRYPNYRENRELSTCPLSHTGLLASAASALHYVWANSFLWMESSLPPIPAPPPSHVNRKRFYIKKRFLRKWRECGVWLKNSKWFLSQVSFLSGWQGDLPHSPTQAERKSMLRTCKAASSNGGSRKAITSMKYGSLSTQVDILGNRLCSSSRWNEQQALCHG